MQSCERQQWRQHRCHEQVSVEEHRQRRRQRQQAERRQRQAKQNMQESERRQARRARGVGNNRRTTRQYHRKRERNNNYMRVTQIGKLPVLRKWLAETKRRKIGVHAEQQAAGEQTKAKEAMVKRGPDPGGGVTVQNEGKTLDQIIQEIRDATDFGEKGPSRKPKMSGPEGPRERRQRRR